MLSSIVDRVLSHSRTIQLMYMAKDIVRDCTLRCKVEDAKDMVSPIKDTALALVKAYQEVREAYESGQTSTFKKPDITSMSKEEQATLKSELARCISEIDKEMQKSIEEK